MLDPRAYWDSADWRVRLLGLWLFDGFVLTCVLIRWYIYTCDHPPKAGTPKARNWTRFWELKSEAEETAAEGDYRSASSLMASALAVIGRPLPETGLSAVPFQLLPWLRFLVRNACGCAFRYRTRCHAAELKREIAIAYHKLNLWQIHVLSQDSYSPLLRAYVAFKAAIYADVAAVVTPPQTLAEVFLTSAYSLRGYSSVCSYFVKNLLKRVDGLILAQTPDTDPVQYSWALSTPGRTYLLKELPDRKERCETVPFVMGKGKCDSVVRMEDEFRVHCLTQLASAALLPIPASKGTSSGVAGLLNGHDCTDLLKMLDVMESARFWHADDYVARWWTHLLGANVMWLTGDHAGARKRYSAIRAVPVELLSNPLALAAGHAFCAKKVLQENASQANAPAAMWDHCVQATENICEHLEQGYDAGGKLAHLTVLLVHDWLLDAMCGLWQSGRFRLGKVQVKCYRRNLALFRVAAEGVPCMNTKVAVYELMWRVMSCSNPLESRAILGSIWKVCEDSETTMTVDQVNRLHFLRNTSGLLLQTGYT